jgi:sugar phosphate isomerase/epimerase
VLLPPDIGVSAFAYEGLPLPVALARVARYARLVEVYSGHLHNLLSASNRAAVRESGLRLTVHGPFDDGSIGAARERERRRAVDGHRRHIEAAADAGALCYVVHPDYSGRARPRDGRVLAALERSFAELEAVQRECGVHVAIENLPGAGHSHLVGPGDLDLGRLSFVLDTGHAVASGTLDAFLAHPPARLAHVHLHDNRGPSDGDDPHLPLGRGAVDAEVVLRVARGAGATVILELLTEEHLLQSIAHLRVKGLVPA